jgi:hypothetical protein
MAPLAAAPSSELLRRLRRFCAVFGANAPFSVGPPKKKLAPEKQHIRRPGVPQGSKKRAYFGGQKRAHFLGRKNCAQYFDLVEKIENTQHATHTKEEVTNAPPATLSLCC